MKYEINKVKGTLEFIPENPEEKKRLYNLEEELNSIDSLRNIGLVFNQSQENLQKKEISSLVFRIYSPEDMAKYLKKVR